MKTVAVFGLGKMGMQIAKRLDKNGFSVFAWNRSEGPRQELQGFLGEKSKVFAEVSELAGSMKDKPRIFWVMLLQNVFDDFVKNQLIPLLKPGDIVIDGGNSFYKDTIRRAGKFREKGVHFFDCGTSGGVWGEENGFALMIGGEKEKWSEVEPIFKALSSGENYGLVGKNGAGHFVKMVHNGIEYGMMQAIAEGYHILKKAHFNLNLKDVTAIYNKGSVIESRLTKWLAQGLEIHGEDLDDVPGKVGYTGEGEWTVNTAKELDVKAKIIEESFKFRVQSQKHPDYTGKILMTLREQFGGHKK
jgi:6-phosphogluconate dehydrogenase